MIKADIICGNTKLIQQIIDFRKHVFIYTCLLPALSLALRIISISSSSDIVR